MAAQAARIGRYCCIRLSEYPAGRLLLASTVCFGNCWKYRKKRKRKKKKKKNTVSDTSESDREGGGGGVGIKVGGG